MWVFLQVVVLFLLLKPCSDLGGTTRSLHFFWWQMWVQEMAQLKSRDSHLWKVGLIPVDLSDLRKGSDWESGPAIVGKIQYSAGQKTKTNTCGKNYPTARAFSFLGFEGQREAFACDQNYSLLAGQARLCFALAWLLYKGTVALWRDALPSPTVL